ncbi:MAG: monovalent cation/H(+) antiporter subunit G [Methanobacteriota archaeon]|nr:MAG: monovalent cation/H(+) antiporter subunit G [Euryarchaeota archaeon]
MILLDMLTIAAMAVGLFFLTVGVVGLLRFPDVYTRMHATTKCDTLGAASVLIGLGLYSGDLFTVAKMLLIIVFIFVANPTAAHAIAKAAYLSGEKPYEGTLEDAYGGDLR